MALFKVLRDCHFKNRYWNEGEIADFPNEELPNEHFRPVNDARIDPEKIIEVLPEPATMSEINAIRKLNQPKTGMAYKEQLDEEPEEKKEVKRGRPAKK